MEFIGAGLEVGTVVEPDLTTGLCNVFGKGKGEVWDFDITGANVLGASAIGKDHGFVINHKAKGLVGCGEEMGGEAGVGAPITCLLAEAFGEFK